MVFTVLFFLLLHIFTFCNAQITGQNLCEFQLDTVRWFVASMNQAIQALATDEQPRIAEIGYQNLLLEKVPGAVQDNYICGAVERCNVQPLAENCNDNPQAATVLKVMASWSNFWQTVSGAITTASGTIRFREQVLRQLFNPDNQELVSIDEAKQPELSQVVMQVLYGSFFVLPPIKAIRNGISPPRDFTQVIQALLRLGTAVAEESSFNAGYDHFNNIRASVDAVQRTCTETIRRYIDDQLNNKAIFSTQNLDSNIIFQLQTGEFTEPESIDVVSIVEKQVFVSVLSPAITRMWNSNQVVILKVNADFFLDGTVKNDKDPCVGDNILPASQKFCDEDGFAYMLRKVPLDPQALQNANRDNLAQRGPFDVPGFDNLRDFFLDNVQAIVETADRSEDEDGYRGAPPSSEEVQQRLAQLDVLQASSRDLLFINMPVCEGEIVDISTTQRDFCARAFPEDTNQCILNMLLLCACQRQVIDDVIDWPYQLFAPQCELETLG